MTTEGPMSGGAGGEAGGSAAVAAAEPAGDAVRVRIEHPARFGHALAQNALPAVRLLAIENAGAAPLADVLVRVTSEPEFSAPWEARIESIPPAGAHVIQPVDLALSPGRLANLAEREAARFAVEVACGGTLLRRDTFPLELLAYNEWPGAGSLPEILAAFVLPNYPAAGVVLGAAARLLGERTGDPVLSGYQGGDPARARETAACVFEALRERRIACASQPASYETAGQKVRTPDQVIEQRLGTCLDLAALYAACLERCGLNPLLVLVEGHAFAGLWLEEESFPDPAVTEPLRLRKRADLDRIALVDAAAAALPGKSDFSSACREARRRLDRPESFLFAVDIASARRQRIRPLPLRGSRPEEAFEPPAAPAVGPGEPDRPRPHPVPAPAAGTPHPAAEPEAPGGRLGRWKRRLLDLSLRNRLLNFRETKKTVRLLCPDLASFEDALAEGKEFTIHPRPALREGTDARDASVHSAQTGRNALEEYLHSEMAARRLRAPLPAEELDRRLLEVYRASRLSLEESGANTLHLALGFLVWYESDAGREPRRAPILLLPLTLSRRSVKEGFRLALADDEARINITLLEKLEKEFHIRVEGPSAIPQDASGLDVASILLAFRQAVLDADRWDIVEEAWMGLFSFNKFLMWRDLEERAPALLENGVVRHLVETPNLPFDPGGPFPEPERLDDERPPARTFCLRDADSSQLAAVFAAADGRSFVLEGPPGTGKSQTITNLVSHCLAEGKTVLFVAEKQAALNVVHRRLNEVGLGPFCLELHSSKASKQQVVRQLGEALAAAGVRSPADWEARARKLEELRGRLNHYARALHRPRESGESAFQLLSGLIGFRGAKRFPLGLEGGGAPDRDRAEAMREAAHGLAATGAALGDVASHPWRGVRREDWGPEVGSAAQALAGELDAAARSIAAALAAVPPAALADAGPPADGWSLAGLERLGEAVRLLLESPGPPAALLEGDWTANRARLAGWIEKGRRRVALRERLRDYHESLLGEDLEELQARLARALGGIPPFSWISLWRLRRRLKPFWSGGRLPRGRRLAEDLDGAIELRRLDGEFAQGAEEGRRLLGGRWKQGEADWDEAERVLGWAESFQAALEALATQSPAGAPPAAGRWIPLACEERARAAPDAPLGLSLRALAAGLDALGKIRGKLSGLLDLDEAAAWGDAAEPGVLVRLERYAAYWTAQPWALREWCAWRRARSEAAGKGLEPLALACERGEIGPAEIPAAFERSFREERLERVYAEEPLLRNFFSPDHEKAIERFRALDRELLDHARQVVIARLSARVPPAIAGAAATNSEMGLLQRELKKQRRHLPVRQLVEKLPNLLPRLKPCLLMSPLSVAQYLDPAFPAADVVVFDEASQIPVWDAVGAISRGAQVVVVGDSRQLPPTMFFEKMEEEDGEPDEEEVVELESILDECVAAGLPRRHLEWHYRSRHESLIAFSNHHYYENRLITFPGAVERSGRLGVSLVRTGGVYDRGGSCANPIEARAVVAEITRRACDPLERGRSIGVVTFSLAQQLLVEDLLEEERRKDPAVDVLFTDAVPEPVFIKNLENVQGDERDVILFSVGYGPDSRGRATMNFGPLNREGGQRRLNVAITRAREQVVVFTSIGAEQIDLDRTRAVGVQHLKAFLDYAERGPAAIAGSVRRAGAADLDSPFEKAVRDALAARGWEADAQVGCSGYRIDLAVKDPRRPGAYLLGIECDGASYRSARTARDRDRLRDEVLRSLGWKLVRIWSSDWWHQPQKVIEDLDRRLRAALEEPTADVSPAAVAAAPAESPPEDAPVPEPAPPQPSPAGFHLSLAGMEPYRPYRPEAAPPPALDYFAGAATGAIRNLLRAVIEAEGPVSLGLAARRIAGLWGIERVTRRVRDRLLEAAERGGSGFDLIDGFFWPPGLRPESYLGFRVPGDDPQAARDPEDIPPEEAANAAQALLRLHISLPLDDLARETGRLFGFQRLGPKVRDAMERGIRLLAARGGCALEENTVSLREPS